ncbi:uncharacterized protein EI90DRAFT_1855570 [Cantharellus anzutake]|uniref:uncharacterized protein n=1 Tax=Cantharellus anzutake TaxID=1750568 RepID=UPI001902CD80|nr:uncharacterized protein EI90DRAFT_2502380 [Cantharellus anzutake]XP_038913260.1 uncharacterized protein EI90DRAFT_1855570 [Cantharellus anzutake]KAF8321471.1 hypothetical protein EI90DRAFT_2502380 [Cantharellus anzutake]KAF8326996.1 hypothetical protein EI90DRAFT_1855570 [Cantharellus anzutake]
MLASFGMLAGPSGSRSSPRGMTGGPAGATGTNDGALDEGGGGKGAKGSGTAVASTWPSTSARDLMNRKRSPIPNQLHQQLPFPRLTIIRFHRLCRHHFRWLGRLHRWRVRASLLEEPCGRVFVQPHSHIRARELARTATFPQWRDYLVTTPFSYLFWSLRTNPRRPQTTFNLLN